nr:hypothetical protein [Pedobacter sp. ASV19]
MYNKLSDVELIALLKEGDHAAKMVAKYGLPAELVKLQAERLKG